MSTWLSWFWSFVWPIEEESKEESDSLKQTGEKINKIKKDNDQTNKKIEEISEGFQKINEKNQKTAEKNKASQEGLKKVNQQLYLIRDETDFEKFCSFIIKDYSKIGYICENMKDIYSIIRLDEDELKIVYDGMDKNDYSGEHVLYDKYLDFNRIVNEIKKQKKHNGGKKLLSIEIIEKEDDFLPPINYYKYTFTQDEFDEKMRNTFEYFFYNYCQGENKLTKNEFKIIYDNMDRSNIYWSKFKKNKYNDFDSMKRTIFYLKKKNGNKELKDIILVKVTDAPLPKNIYKYLFKEN